MADRLDIVIFGASGFTGKYTIPQVHKLAKAKDLTWGVAGRSESKLRSTLDEISKLTGADLSSTPVIVADVKDEESLKQMAARARVVINTAGPYRFYGEPVVKACIDAGTHHVDVSGEPQYMETMQLKYHEEAKEKGVYIISACGLDSIPIDLGVIFLQNKFEGTVNSVETYLEAKEEGNEPGASVNYGTWESAVHGLANYGELQKIRSQLFPQRTPQFKPKLQARGNFHKFEQAEKWALPFLGSDRSVVLRTQRYFYEHEKKRPVQVHTYFCPPSLLAIIAMVILGGVFALLSKFEFGRNLLLNHPRFFSLGMFSHEGPSVAKQENTTFSITIVGEGWSEKTEDANKEFESEPDKKLTVKVSGKNPGYGSTTIALTLAAITILQDSKKMPNNGGVYPPGAAFAHTSLIEELDKNGVKFEVVSV